VDVLGDADPDRYDAALAACLADPGVDGALVVLTPQAHTRPEEVARAVIARASESRKPVLTCWMGDPSVASSRTLFHEHDLPTFGTPEAAVDAFEHLDAYRVSQAQLLQVPEPLGPRPVPDVEAPGPSWTRCSRDDRRVATLAESKAVLAAFGIPILRSIPAHSAADAVLIAQELASPVALKIASPDITHKSDVGGVVLGLVNAREVHTAGTT
jgi:acetyltransferase